MHHRLENRCWPIRIEPSSTAGTYQTARDSNTPFPRERHCITERFWLSQSARRSRRIAQSGFRSAFSPQGEHDAAINSCDSAGSHNTTIVLPLSFAQK
jgi:hypothetical protein